MAGASVVLASLLIGLSAGAAAWAIEAGILSHSRAGRVDDVRRALRDARDLLGRRDRVASRQAASFAARQDVQNAFVARDAAPLIALSASHPSVGFVLWNGRTVGRAAGGVPSSSLSIYSHGNLAGRVVVAAEPNAALLSSARRGSRIGLFYTVGGRVAAASPAIGSRSVADILRHTVSDATVLAAGPRAPATLYGYTSKPGIPVRWLWPLLLAALAAGISFRILGSREATRRAEPPPNPVRDAVALVGETLAATHNPEALLPVILQAAVEATDAVGGSIMVFDAVLAARGSTPADAVEVIEVPLEVSQGRSAVMRLYSSTTAGFGPAAKDAAAWIAAQALIALENARLHGQVQRQAVTDELTGLANRRRFLAQLDAEVTRSRRNGSPLGIILADLDDFKRVNDTYGHEVGDEALRNFAAILQGTVRDVDLPVRLGGEEFAVLVPDTDLEGAALLAERIRHELEASRPEHPDGEPFRLTASFGVSCFPSAATAEDLLSDADRRLYEAKHRGKNVVIASSDRGMSPRAENL
jgi:diguanylate cyclase (GGDEF)-like protein